LLVHLPEQPRPSGSVHDWTAFRSSSRRWNDLAASENLHADFEAGV
jgi:hypothetical protein